MVSATPGKPERSKFPPLYWLVVVFEFFERGSYYGMMSVLSVYLVDVLGFAKQDVGLIKGTIQPLLYFLPILSGALADRFGYRRMLMFAFALLGGGYFLTSQATGYAAVFLSLVVLGIGAGTFKPIISGTIARCTDKSNSTLGFGIFYWSINLGAFLFPLVLVPFLRDNIGWTWVIIASAIGTGAMLIPTFLFFREPPKPADADDSKPKASLVQTLANAFEIIYSPLVLLYGWARTSSAGMATAVILIAGLIGGGAWLFAQPQGTTHAFAARAYRLGDTRLVVQGEPNLCKADPFKLNVPEGDDAGTVVLSLHHPQRLEEFEADLLAALAKVPALSRLGSADLQRFRDEAVGRTILDVEVGAVPGSEGFAIDAAADGGRVRLVLRDAEAYMAERSAVLAALAAEPRLAALDGDEIDQLVDKANKRSFLLLFVGLLFAGGLLVQRLAAGFKGSSTQGKLLYVVATLAVYYLVIWLLPGLSLFARVLTSVLSVTVLALYAIDYTETARFKDHLRFLAMIGIYSGFWVLYFQMFDSVLWYVQRYVDATSLNSAVNSVVQALGLGFTWRFDVEIVTVINAFTIILLQLAVSAIVKNTKALPTMVVGIALGTAGMAILAVSPSIWVFMAGIVLFSIGEMTAHPKFISYVGQTAPKSRVAMYMGYLFLYGVIGSSVGGVMGANLYVKFVDELNQPRTLWLIFTGIGVATVVGLLLYNRFLVDRSEEDETGAAGGDEEEQPAEAADAPAGEAAEEPSAA